RPRLAERAVRPDPADRELDPARLPPPPPAHDRVAVVEQLDVDVAERAVAIDVHGLAEGRAAVDGARGTHPRLASRRREPGGDDRVAARRDRGAVDRAALDAPAVGAEHGRRAPLAARVPAHGDVADLVGASIAVDDHRGGAGERGARRAAIADELVDLALRLDRSVVGDPRVAKAHAHRRAVRIELAGFEQLREAPAVEPDG